MKIIGAILVILALVAGIVPQFSDCQSQGRAIELANGKTIAMKCHWTGEAELATAGPLFVLGGLVAFNRRKEVIRNLSILGIVLGAFIIALPTVLIGVCASADMLCNSLMRPTLILTGILVIAVSGMGLYQSMKKDEPAMPGGGMDQVA